MIYYTKCFFSTDQFDLDLMEEASKLFVGYYDFRTFMNKSFGDSKLITRKYIDNVKIITRELPGYSNYSWPSFSKTEYDQYLAIDIYIKGPSFLYRQVSYLLIVLKIRAEI